MDKNKSYAIKITEKNKNNIMKQLNDYDCKWNSGHSVYEWIDNSIGDRYVLLHFTQHWCFGIIPLGQFENNWYEGYTIIKDLHMRKEKLKRILNEKV